jgi:hypothetical protein
MKFAKAQDNALLVGAHAVEAADSPDAEENRQNNQQARSAASTRHEAVEAGF